MTMDNIREDIAHGFFERERDILKIEIQWDELFPENIEMYFDRADNALTSIGIPTVDLENLRAGTHKVVKNER